MKKEYYDLEQAENGMKVTISPRNNKTKIRIAFYNTPCGTSIVGFKEIKDLENTRDIIDAALKEYYEEMNE